MIITGARFLFSHYTREAKATLKWGLCYFLLGCACSLSNTVTSSQVTRPVQRGQVSGANAPFMVNNREIGVDGGPRIPRGFHEVLALLPLWLFGGENKQRAEPGTVLQVRSWASNHLF